MLAAIVILYVLVAFLFYENQVSAKLHQVHSDRLLLLAEALSMRDLIGGAEREQ